MKKRLALVNMIFLLAVTLLTSCGGAPLLPGSRAYEPISDSEKTEFDKADRNAYPDDVRKDLTSFQSTTIAWPGLIDDIQIQNVEEGVDITYSLTHHYYDWIEDFGIQHERIFLSPRGEGKFKFTWPFPKNLTEDELKRFTDHSVLLIVYGKPVSIQNDTIIIEASYVRDVGKSWYTTHRLDYGR